MRNKAVLLIRASRGLDITGGLVKPAVLGKVRDRGHTAVVREIRG